MKRFAIALVILPFFFTACGKASKAAPENKNYESIHNIETLITGITGEVYAGGMADEQADENSGTGEDEISGDDVNLSSLELLGVEEANIRIKNSDQNKFIGYIDIAKLFPGLRIGGIFIYEKYIVLEELYKYSGQWHGGRFCAYEYDENLKINEYKKLGKKLYDSAGEAAFFKGIYGGLLFTEFGTGPGIRSVKVFDLVNNEAVLNAYYNNNFSFNNNYVRGLILTEGCIKNGAFDGSVTEAFDSYKEKTAMPEDNHGLYREFVLEYKFNVLTNEIEIIRGEYILLP